LWPWWMGRRREHERPKPPCCKAAGYARSRPPPTHPSGSTNPGSARGSPVSRSHAGEGSADGSHGSCPQLQHDGQATTPPRGGRCLAALSMLVLAKHHVNHRRAWGSGRRGARAPRHSQGVSTTPARWPPPQTDANPRLTCTGSTSLTTASCQRPSRSVQSTRSPTAYLSMRGRLGIGKASDTIPPDLSAMTGTRPRVYMQIRVRSMIITPRTHHRDETICSP
jgi:hypothetical protein